MFQCKELLKGITYECIQGTVEREVSEVVYDSRKIVKDCLFICICGYNADGHDFACEAVKKGASVLVVQKEVQLPSGGKHSQESVLSQEGGSLQERDVTVIRVEDTRYAMAFISAAYFGHPADRLKVIGITGTKGKTTTAYLIRSILESAGYKTGLVGTIETIIGERHIPAANTTPESFLLQKYFKEMEEEGCQLVVMEAASQGFKLHRTQGFIFEIGIFTNLEPDHIGPNEHADFEEYQACKGLLFQQCRLGIVNIDDKHAEAVLKGHTCKLETYGFDHKADFYADNLELIRKPGELGIDFTAGGKMNLRVEVPAPGRFSVYNALTAIAVCSHFQVEASQIQKALLGAHVKGRIEMVPVSDQFTLLIDYAHNEMSLKSLLTTLREYQPARLVCLFGCGGNRSRDRRFGMGEVSGTYADLTIITSDNPRNEEPQAIIEDIKTGIQKTEGAYVEICDREEAIAYAIDRGQPGDIIVLAGKGHEDYQEIKGVKYPMDERVLIAEILKERRKSL